MDLCKSVENSQASISSADLTKIYQENYIDFGMDIYLLTYISNNSFSKDGQLVPGPAIAAAFFVVLIILMAFIQFIISILNMCCCNRRANPTEKQASICLKLMILFTFLYIVAFILVTIYASFIINNSQVIFCSFANIPYKIISGVNDSNRKFLGLTPLTDTLSLFSNNLSNFSSVSSNIAAINNLSLGSKGQTVLNQIPLITNAVTGVTTLDAASTNSVS